MFKAEKPAGGSQRQSGMRFPVLGMAALAAGSLAVSGCGITVQRDLSSVKANEVAYDDLCGLQGYFDALKDTTLAPPQELFNQAVASEIGEQGGKSRFRFSSDFQLKNVRRVLTENWKRLPPEVQTSDAVELEVRWSEKAGLKRVVTTEEAILQVGEKSYYLPYHVCLSELLFGEPLYETRRTFLALPSGPPSPFAKPGQQPSDQSSSRPRVLDATTPTVPASTAGDGAEKQPEGDADVPVAPVSPTPAAPPQR